jgi:hypothetical protein
MSLPDGMRKFGPICILPRKIGLPMEHHRHLRYKEGNFIRHEKNLPSQDVRRPGILSYDAEKDIILVEAGKIISRPGYEEMFKITQSQHKQKIAPVNATEVKVVVMENRYIDLIPDA